MRVSGPTKVAALCCALVIAATAGAACAFTITFSPLAGPNDTNYLGHDEGTFRVIPSTGLWREGHVFGAPIPSIFSRDQTASIDVIDFTTSMFTFQSIDLASANVGTDVPFTIEGFRGGMVVLSTGGTTLPAVAFETIVSPDPALVLDRLRVTMNLGNTTSYNIDNIAVTRVIPEPASAVAASVVIGAARRRRWRQEQLVANQSKLTLNPPTARSPQRRRGRGGAHVTVIASAPPRLCG